MCMMARVWSNYDLHEKAAAGFKRAGLSIDVHGLEDLLVCNEAAEMFWKETGGGFANMREKLNHELDIISKQYANHELPWTRETLESLVEPYPAAKDDAVLAKHGDLAGHMEHYLDGPAAISEEDADESSSSSDGECGAAGDDMAAAHGEESASPTPPVSTWTPAPAPTQACAHCKPRISTR